MANFDLSALALKAVCPTNEIMTDDKGMPSVYVRVGKQTLNNLLSTSNITTHPAFTFGENEKDSILIGKYQAKIHNGRMYSLPMEDPGASYTYDSAMAYARAKGGNNHVITAAEWAFLALWCKKNGTQPYGNNNFGKDNRETNYVAIPSMAKDSSGRIQRVATGSGPLTWSHDRTIGGIWDLNGNVWEWLADLRLVYGEIQTIPYNKAAISTTAIGAASTEWKALNAQATDYSDLFITPDGSGTTSGSIKMDYVNSHWQWDTTITDTARGYKSALFQNTTMTENLSDFAKLYLRAMALAPEDGDTNYEGDNVWANNAEAERLAIRGGHWSNGASNGVFSLYLSTPRSFVDTNIGSRPALFE